ncbi:MAG: hypothetical protein ABI024_15300, partial [Vicinamibacterales bacterium]
APLTKSGPMRLAGHPLDVHLTDKAVSDAEVWLFDKATRVAVIGDLVAVPVPYLETACPERWRASLDEVWATTFEIAIPGHGRPMTRAQFDSYRKAYGAFVSCVQSSAAPAQCSSGWVDGIGALIGDDTDRPRIAPRSERYAV